MITHNLLKKSNQFVGKRNMFFMNLDNTKVFNERAREGCINQT